VRTGQFTAGVRHGVAVDVLSVGPGLGVATEVGDAVGLVVSPRLGVGDGVGVAVGVEVDGVALGSPLRLVVGAALEVEALGLGVPLTLGVGLGVCCFDPPPTIPLKDVRVDGLLPPV